MKLTQTMIESGSLLEAVEENLTKLGLCALNPGYYEACQLTLNVVDPEEASIDPAGCEGFDAKRRRRPVGQNRKRRFAVLYRRTKQHPYDRAIFRRGKLAA